MIRACAAQEWAQELIKKVYCVALMSAFLFVISLLLSSFLGLPLVVLWMESWDFSYPALYFLWLYLCSVPRSSRTEKGKKKKKKTTGVFPTLLGSQLLILELWDYLGAGMWGNGEKKKKKRINGEFFLSSWKLGVSFPTSWVSPGAFIIAFWFRSNFS